MLASQIRRFVGWSFFLFALMASVVAPRLDGLRGQENAEGAAAANPAAAPAAAPKAEAGESDGPQRNLLVWLAEVSGLIGLLILGLSVYFVSVVIRQMLELQQANMIPKEVVAQCEQLLESGNIKDLYNVVAEDDSLFSRTLQSGLDEIENSVDEAREKIERTVEMATVEMERKIGILATLGTLGPMIGLLGTLKGMIGSFMAIAFSGKSLEAEKVAAGISEALVLTFEGVALSIPAIYFFALFRGRIASISVNVSTLADEFLRKIVRSLKKSRQAPPAPQKV